MKALKIVWAIIVGCGVVVGIISGLCTALDYFHIDSELLNNVVGEWLLSNAQLLFPLATFILGMFLGTYLHKWYSNSSSIAQAKGLIDSLSYDELGVVMEMYWSKSGTATLKLAGPIANLMNRGIIIKQFTNESIAGLQNISTGRPLFLEFTLNPKIRKLINQNYYLFEERMREMVLITEEDE